MIKQLLLADVAAILRNYSLGSLKSTKLLHKGWNIAYKVKTTKGDYVVKPLSVSGKKDLENEFWTLHALGKDIPHLLPIPTIKGEDYLIWKKQFVYIVPFVAGKIVHEGTTLSPTALSEVGSCLAKIHKTKLKGVRTRDIYNEFRSRFGKSNSLATETLVYLEKQGFYAAKLPTGFLHADLHTENMIFRENTIVAILDFEHSHLGPFLHDIGWVMIDTCFKAGKLSRRRMNYVLRGYESIRKLTKLEKQHLENAILHAGLLELQYCDIALKRGEDLSKNEGCIAFKNRLMWLLHEKKKNESSPQVLYHGSRHKIQGDFILPRKATDSSQEANGLNAVYATDRKDIALGMALTGGNTHSMGNFQLKKFKAVFVRGEPTHKWAYLYVVSSKGFKEMPKGSHQWVTQGKVKIIARERRLVKDMGAYWRNATQSEKEYYRREKGRK